MERDHGGDCAVSKWSAHTVGSTPTRSILGQTLGGLGMAPTSHGSARRGRARAAPAPRQMCDLAFVASKTAHALFWFWRASWGPEQEGRCGLPCSSIHCPCLPRVPCHVTQARRCRPSQQGIQVVWGLGRPQAYRLPPLKSWQRALPLKPRRR